MGGNEYARDRARCGGDDVLRVPGDHATIGGARHLGGDGWWRSPTAAATEGWRSRSGWRHVVVRAAERPDIVLGGARRDRRGDSACTLEAAR
jgi:hypothetical protein